MTGYLSDHARDVSSVSRQQQGVTLLGQVTEGLEQVRGTGTSTVTGTDTGISEGYRVQAVTLT